MTSSCRSGRILSHLTRAATVAAACAAPAGAEVVTWNINQNVPLTLDGVYVRIDTQATTTSAGTALPGWDINPYGTTTLNFYAVSTSPNPATTYVRTQTTGGPSSLPAGTVIGSSSTFVNSTTAVITAAGVGSNGWSLNGTHIVGFRFNPGTTAGTVRYGYAEFQVGASATERTLLRVHWENSGGPITVGPIGPPPPYDPCGTGNPTLGSGNNSVAFRTDAADGSASCGTLASANTYRFTPPWSGQYTIRACPTGAPVQLAVRDACDPASAERACGTSACGGNGSEATLGLTSGVPVFVVVGGSAGAEGLASTIAIEVVAPPAPPIEACVSAPALAFGSNPVGNASSTAQVTARATTTTTSTLYKATFFKFTPTVTGRYTFSMCGAVNDTKLAIGTACPITGQTFQSLAYNDDSCACTSGCGTSGTLTYASRINGTNSGIPLNQDLLAGTTYYLLLGSFSTTSGAVSGDLVIDGPPQVPACPGDLDGDGSVNGVDLGIILGNWDTANPVSDLNGDGATNGLDLGILLGGWGSCPA